MHITALTHPTPLFFAAKRAGHKKPAPDAIAQIHRLDRDDVSKLRQQLGLMPTVSEKTVLQAYSARVRNLLRQHLGLKAHASDLAIHAAVLTQYQNLEPVELAKALKKSNPAYVAQIMKPYKEPEVLAHHPVVSTAPIPATSSENHQTVVLH